MITPRSVQPGVRQQLMQGLLVGVPVALVLLAIWWLNLFVGARLRVNNVYFVAAEQSDQIVIAALDDASLQTYGRSPMAWDRRVYADLLERLNAGGARVVAFDLLFAEESADDDLVAAAIQTIRSSDTRTRTVLAASGAGNPQFAGGVMRFENVLHPQPILADAADYVALVNTVVDADGTIRRQSSRVQVGDEAALSFSLSAYLAYLRIPAAAVSQLVLPDGDALQVTPERRLPIDEGGLWLQNFYGMPGTTFPIVSLRAILAGEVPPETFADKIVLVGIINTQGATDRYFVPTSINGQQMAGVEIQAHAIESLLRNQPIIEQSPASQVIMMLLLTIGSAVLYAWLRWYWKLLLAAALLVGLFVIASINFSVRDQMLNLFHGGLAILLPVGVSIGLDITSEMRRRQQTEFLLESVVDVSGQQLATDKILARIAEDIWRILPAANIGIWLDEAESPRLHEFPMIGSAAALNEIMEQAKLTGRSQTALKGDQIAVPLNWQQRLIGVIGAQVEAGKRIEPARLILLEQLAQEIAPGLENAILYRETQRQKELSQMILNGSPAYTAILDGDGMIRQVNDVFNVRLQSQFPDFADKNLLNLFQSMGMDDASRVRLQRLFDKREPFQAELRLEQETFNVYATLLAGYNLWVVVLSDVTALAELNRLKTQMIRMASHDLKNPLSVVQGYTNLILMNRDQLSPEHQRFMDFIGKAGDTMLNLINDILNLEQLRSTEMPDERVQLNRLVYDVVSRHEPDIALKKQVFKLDLQRDLPPMIGRPTQLAQVISNLLGNAIKYTAAEGSITLRVYAPSPQVIRLEVQDTGYGISQEAQKKLFTEFYRVKTAATASIPGTGLGLSLVKSVVEAHHGRIWVESEEKVGSTFYVEFPAADEAMLAATDL